MSATATLAGFNDGIRAGASGDDIEVVLSPRNARAADTLKADTLVQTDFVDELGYMGEGCLPSLHFAQRTSRGSAKPLPRAARWMVAGLCVDGEE